MRQFKILASQLPAVSGGVGSPRPSKFIIKFLFTNFIDPINSMKLLLYPANDHAHYGSLTNPIVIDPIPGSTVTVQNILTLGNLEIVTSQLLKAVPPGPLNTYFFHHLILTPDTTIIAPDLNPHLIFHIKAYDASGIEVHSGQITMMVIDDGNPSPPKPPVA